MSLFDGNFALNAAEIKEKTDKNPNTVCKAIQNLVKNGFLVKLGATKGVAYKLKK